MSRSAGAPNPKRVSESSRTTRLVARRGLGAPPAAGGRRGRRVHQHPDAPHLDDDVVEPDVGDGSPHRGDHRRASSARAASRTVLRAPPGVADRQGERVRGVGRARSGLEAEDAGDHSGDLGLVGPTRPGDRRLDLGRGVEHDGDAALGRREEGDGGRVRRRHDRGHVDVGEHPLDGDDLGLEAREPPVELTLQEDEPLPRVAVSRGAHDTDGNHRRAAGSPVDDAQPAPGQAGVDAEHAHVEIPSPRRHPGSSDAG